MICPKIWDDLSLSAIMPFSDVDDLEHEAFFALVYGHLFRPSVPRLVRSREAGLDFLRFMDGERRFMSEESWYANFRINPNLVGELAEEMSLPNPVHFWTTALKLLCLLRYLAFPTRYIDYETFMGISKATAHAYVDEASRFIVTLVPRCVTWPDVEERNRTAEVYKNVAPAWAQPVLPRRYIGSGDGSQIPIVLCNASHAERSAHINRKTVQTILLLASANYTLKFYYMLTGCPGSAHDAYAASLAAPTWTNPENFDLGNGLMGSQLLDAAFGIGPYATALMRGQDAVSSAFNKAHTPGRKFIECAFGRLKKKFSVLKFGLVVETSEKAHRFVRCAVVLHNLAIDENPSYPAFQAYRRDRDRRTQTSGVQPVDSVSAAADRQRLAQALYRARVAYMSSR